MTKEPPLPTGSIHPSARLALKWLMGLGPERLREWQECFASPHLANDPNVEQLRETINKLMAKQPVSERGVLGLAWWVRDTEDQLMANARKARRDAKKKKPKV